MIQADVLASSKVNSYKTGDVIIKEGQASDGCLYYVLLGTCMAFKNVHGEHIILNYIPAGSFFGEIALVLGIPRTASVVADAPEVKIVAIDQQVFRNLALKNFKFMQGLYITALQRSSRLLSHLFSAGMSEVLRVPQDLTGPIESVRDRILQITKKLNNIRSSYITPHRDLFKENQNEDGNLFIVLEGIMHFSHRTDSGKKTSFTTFLPGDIFGTGGLIGERKRFTTASAGDKLCRVLMLDYNLFFQIMRWDGQLFYDVFCHQVIMLLTLQKAYEAAKEQQQTIRSA
jgi:CRP-like cAMP-binding protein